MHGGTSLFVDAFAAAESLRVSHPPDFTRLATTPVPFQYLDDSRHLHYARPIITLDPAGGNIEPRVTAVSYSPPFQAPFPLNIPHDFYDALARFAALVEAPAAVYSHQLEEGEAVVFDNRRVLHGRTAFEVWRLGRMGGREASVSRVGGLRGVISRAMSWRAMVGFCAVEWHAVRYDVRPTFYLAGWSIMNTRQ